MAAKGRLKFEGLKFVYNPRNASQMETNEVLIPNLAIYIDWEQEPGTDKTYPYSKIRYDAYLYNPGPNRSGTVYDLEDIDFRFDFSHSYTDDNGKTTSKTGTLRFITPYGTTDTGLHQKGTHFLMSGYLEDDYGSEEIRHNQDGTVPTFNFVSGSSRFAFNGASLSTSITSIGVFSGDGAQRIDGVAPTGDWIGFDAVLIPSTVSHATSAYIGDHVPITINSISTSYTHVINYSFNGKTGTAVSQTTDKKPTWEIPMSLIGAVGSDSTYGTCKLTTYTYGSSGSLLGSTTSEILLFLDVNESAPLFNPTARDTNSATIALTGNDQIFIRYYSDVYVNIGAAAKDGATIVEQKAYCGSASFTGATGYFNDIQDGIIDIQATDSRGFTGFGTINRTLIPYLPVTCALITYPISTNGEASFTVEGNFYNGSFGVKTNQLTVEYRYKLESDSAYSDWIALNVDSNTSNYAINIDLTGLDYKKVYMFQARARDLLSDATSPVGTVASFPIFDWGRFDFNFNVPVSFQEETIHANDANIYGTNTNDETRLAFTACDSANNTTVGFGGYDNEEGSTIIYGNKVDIISNTDIGFNGFNISNIINALTKSYSFTPTVTKGGNFSNASCALTLRGNCLYCRVYGSRTAASGAGDISDEIIASISFNHGGKITGMDYVSSASSSGPTAVINMSDVIVDGAEASFTVSLTSTAAGGRSFLSSFVIPVSIDLTKFTS